MNSDFYLNNLEVAQIEALFFRLAKSYSVRAGSLLRVGNGKV